MAVKQLSDSRSDGVQMGDAATDLCGFFGTTPVVQPAITAVATATATTTLNETRITRLYTALTSIGIVNTAG